MQSKQLWYTRRGNEVRGPFPAPQISRFILLGRIRETDELSSNQHDWQKVSDVPVLMPEELKANQDDPAARERLLIARMREDERSAHNRRREVVAEIMARVIPKVRRWSVCKGMTMIVAKMKKNS